MGQVLVAPVQWSKFKDIDDTDPVGESDYDCLHDMRDVLRKHGKLERFGVALLHSHFNPQPGEAWLEECDEESRTLVTRPVPEAEAHQGNIGTIWQLQDGDVHAMSWCRKYCRDGIFGHSKSHNTVPGR